MIFTETRPLWPTLPWVVRAALCRLSLPVLHDVIQDRQVFIWAATQLRLAKPAGHTVKTFRPWDVTKIPHALGIQLFSWESSDLLWFGSMQSPHQFDPKDDGLRPYDKAGKTAMESRLS